MPTNVMSSVLGNLVAQRAKIGQVRQRLNLESGPSMPGGASVRRLAPSPQQPAQATSAATEAVQFQIPPEKREKMLGVISQFLDQWGEQQQGLADQERTSQEVPVSPGAPPAGGAAPPTEYRAAPPGEGGAPIEMAAAPKPRAGGGGLAQRAASPIVEFYDATGRLPSMEEVRVMTAYNLLTRKLGRDPSQDEVRLYLLPPEV